MRGKLARVFAHRVVGLPAWIVLILTIILISGLGVRLTALQTARLDMAMLPSDTPHFVSAAEHLPVGLGYVDDAAVERFQANPSGYRARWQSDPRGLRWFSWNDPGLGVIYAAAMAIFGNAASPPLMLLWLQIVTETLNILLMFWLGRQVRGDGFGLLCAGLYSGYVPIAELAGAHPYYFFWTATLSLWHLALLCAVSNPDGNGRGAIWKGVAYGALVGFASLVRPTFALMALFGVAVVLVRWRWNWRAVAPFAVGALVTQAAVLAPLAVKSYHAYGQLRPPRPFHHMMYIGFGGHPNPYGIRFDDDDGFRLARAHGLSGSDPRWRAKYDLLLADEVSRIRREHPWLWPRNTVLNVYEALSLTYSKNELAYQLAGLRATLSLPIPLAIFLLIAAQVVLYRRVVSNGSDGNGSRGGAVYGIAALQAAYFVVTLAVIMPPYTSYNTGAVPTLLLFVGGAIWILFDFLRKMARDDLPLPAPILALAILNAGWLCWMLGSIEFLDQPMAPTACLMLAPVAAILASQVMQRVAGPREGQVANALVLALAVLSLILWARAPAVLASRLSPGTFPQMVLGLWALRALVAGGPPWLPGGVLPIASRVHGEVCALPGAVLLLIRRPVPSMPCVTAFTAAAVVMGVLLVASARRWGVSLSYDAALLPIMLPVAAFVAKRAPFAVSIVLAIALLVLRVRGLHLWPSLGLILLLASFAGPWLRHPAEADAQTCSDT